MKKDFFIAQVARFEGPITQMISLFPEDKLEWQPTDNTFKARALIQHLIDSTPAMSHMLVTNQWDPRPGDLDGGQGKTQQQLLQEVKKAFEQTRATLGQMSQESFETSRGEIKAGPIEFEGTLEELGVSLVLVHLSYHVMQLFWYLRQVGVDADSGTLYFGMPPGQFSTRTAAHLAQA